MCQVGLPRRPTTARTFERTSGNASILLEAGSLYDGRDWIQQALPFGVTPRLILVHVSSEAVRTKSRTIEIGDTMRQFLSTLGMHNGGGPRGGYGALRRQLLSLAACRLTIGMCKPDRAVSLDAKPIKRFDAWIQEDARQRVLWPGSLELSEDFFDSLVEHAVPLDPRAVAALKHSALALDIYAWLTHRLYRVAKANGVKLSWTNLREQFGHEYSDPRNFKREFRSALRQVLVVYPGARVGQTMGGIRLYQSPPPIAKTTITLRPSISYSRPVDN